MSERHAEQAGAAWFPLDKADCGREWARFEGRYGFRASTEPEGWPAVYEPPESLTLDLSVIQDGPRRGAAYDAINAEALRCFVWALEGVEDLLVFDWQHPSYRFDPAVQALTWRGEWAVPVYPDGDYFAFMTPSLDLRSSVGGDPLRHRPAPHRDAGPVSSNLATPEACGRRERRQASSVSCPTRW